MELSPQHCAAFRKYQTRGFTFDGLSHEDRAALAEDPHFAKAIGDWQRKALQEGARQAEQQARREQTASTASAVTMEVLRSTFDAFGNSVVEMIVMPLVARLRMLETATAELQQKNAALEQQIAGRTLLAAKGLWNARERYAPGDTVVKDGSSWCALTDAPRSVPGDKSAGEWQLLASRGAPGKDAPR